MDMTFKLSRIQVMQSAVIQCYMVTVIVRVKYMHGYIMTDIIFTDPPKDRGQWNGRVFTECTT